MVFFRVPQHSSCQYNQVICLHGAETDYLQTTATIALGQSLSAKPMEIVGTVLAGILVAVWLMVTYMMLRALFRRRLLWPEREEDREKTPVRVHDY